MLNDEEIKRGKKNRCLYTHKHVHSKIKSTHSYGPHFCNWSYGHRWYF